MHDHLEGMHYHAGGSISSIAVERFFADMTTSFSTCFLTINHL